MDRLGDEIDVACEDSFQALTQAVNAPEVGETSAPGFVGKPHQEIDVRVEPDRRRAQPSRSTERLATR